MTGGLLQLVFVVGSLVFLLGIWLVLRGPAEIQMDSDRKRDAAAAATESRGAGDEPPGAGPKSPKRAA